MRSNEAPSRVKLNNRSSVCQWQVNEAEARALVSDGVSVAFLLDFANEAVSDTVSTENDAAPEASSVLPESVASAVSAATAASVTDVREYCRQQLTAANDIVKMSKAKARPAPNKDVKLAKGSAKETSSDAVAKQNSTMATRQGSARQF
jgi:hypothetical protein